MPLVYLVVGARPNFMKIAPIVRAIEARGDLDYEIIHTGQHYDREMNGVFFEEFGIPEPRVFMAAGGGSHAEQTGRIMIAFEQCCQQRRPSAVLVVGDVNSTLACAIVAKKLCIPVAHVEAGLRSGDMTMPEEINRLVTDSISDWFFVTEPSGVAHLKREGKAPSAIHFVGHVMVDNLLYQAEQLARTGDADFDTAAHTIHIVWRVGHRFLTAGNDDLRVSGFDGLRRQHDRLQTGTAHFVHRHRRHRRGHTSFQHR